MSDLEQLNNRMIALETITKERWDAHDKRSDERWDNIADQYRDVIKRLNNLQCPAHIERMNGIHNQLKLIWGVVITVIVVGIVLGVWVNAVIAK